MNNLGKITILLTILLLIFCFNATRAERTELTATLPSTIFEGDENAVDEFGLSVEAGGSLSSIMRLAYSDLDLQQQESTWTRLVRETISLNDGLIANPDPTELHNPAANRVEPGTVLQLPAIAVVEEGDTGIGRVLIRLNPELKGNGRALLRAIKETIAANADLIRKADVNQLYNGRFNVIVVGDVLILPPEMMPRDEIRQPVQPHTMVAEKAAADEAAIPSTEENVEETAEQIAAVAETRPEQTEEAIPSTEENVEETAEQIAAVAEAGPEQTQASPVDIAPAALAQAEAVPAEEAGDAATAPLAGEPYPAIAIDAFTGPIGLTAWETRVREIPTGTAIALSGAHLLIAYMLAGLALLGLLVVLITRWFDRDREFRAQVNLFFTVAVFMITLGLVRRKPAIEVTADEKDRLALSDPDGKQKHSKPA